MFYSIRHLTRFRYDSPVSESLMELRMHPRTEGPQRCLSYRISVDPRARLSEYRDYLGNTIHHFDVPGAHTQLRIDVEALVEVLMPPPLPQRLEIGAWQELDDAIARGDYWEMLVHSQFTHPTPALEELFAQLKIERADDPLTFLRTLNQAIFSWFDYAPKTTSVDSPIDHAIEARAGVCQDFAHIMIAMARHVRIPCRYVSGYLCPSPEKRDRSSGGATHAWVEALLPGIGWIGFDPTNNLIAGERHIRTAIGRDYADVPPTKGIFKGDAASELSVSVRVAPSDTPPPPPEIDPAMATEWIAPRQESPLDSNERQRQQQQQQQ